MLVDLLLRSGAEPVRLNADGVRLFGGILSDRVSHQSIATLIDNQWQRAGLSVSVIRFSVPTRLLFGIARHPWRLSEPFEALSVKGGHLLNQGQPFASYYSGCDMWRATERPIWWQSAHVVEAHAFDEELSEAPEIGVWRLLPRNIVSAPGLPRFQ